MARHHKSKRHITMHDREQDRENLMGGSRHYEYGERTGKRESVHYERNERPRNTDMGKGEYFMNESSERRAMKPNNARGSFIQEDWKEPALLKRGVHEFDVTYHANKHRSGRIGDLYEQVDKTTREDQNAFDSLTDPHNW